MYRTIFALFALDAIHRILVRHTPVLECYRSQRNSGDDQERQCEYPPMDRGSLGEVLQPFMDTIKSEQRGDHETNRDDTQVKHIEHQQDLAHGRTMYFAETDLLPAILGLEDHQTKYTHDGKHNRKEAE